MGLFISKQIVKQFNGELDFYSTCSQTTLQQQGSTFIFTFDLQQDHEKKRIESLIADTIDLAPS